MRTPPDRRPWIATILGAFIVAATPLAAARADSLAHVDVYDRSAGEALPTYRHHGRRYVEGRPGNLYAVRVRNRTGGRLLAVVSVDGVNVLSGDTAAPDQSGYVIEPGGYVTIQGWRKDLDRTAAFYFSDPETSYAARTGRPDDLGVIGVALFREREYVEPQAWSSSQAREDGPVPMAHRESAGKSSNAPAPPPSTTTTRSRSPAHQSAEVLADVGQPSLGTGHGQNEYSPVRWVAFERASSRPDEVVTLRYERRETLVAMGVLPRVRHDARDPDPFPGALGFVPDP